MDSLISLLREKRNIRNAEREKIEATQELEHRTLMMDLEKLKDERLQCTELIVKNLNTITGHRHTISKVVHESDQYTGLPISNTHHRQAVDFLSNAMNLVNEQEDLYKNKNSKDSIDACKLSMDVQLCAQSTADSFKAIKSSTDKAESLIHNIHIIVDQYSDKDLDLETSIFYE